jgi:tryptophanyl-tRNA synthetase
VVPRDIRPLGWISLFLLNGQEVKNMRLISGIQPSGTITLGNYLGAIKNFVKLQDDPKFDDFLVFVADLHAITVSQDKTKLRQNIKSLAAIYLACGLNPE